MHIFRGNYGNFIPTVLWLSDLAILNLLFLVVVLSQPEVAANPGIHKVWALVTIAYLPVLIWLRPQKMQLRAFVFEYVVSRAIVVVVTHASVFLILLAIINTDLPAASILEYYLTMAIGVPLWWSLTRLFLKAIRRKGYNYLRVVIVGAGHTAHHLIEGIRSDAGFGLNVIGIFSDHPHEDFPYEVTGKVADLEEFVKSHNVDQIYFTLAGENEGQISTVLRVADANMIDFLYVPLISHRIARGFDLHTIGSVPVLSIRVNKLSNAWNRGLKRAFDIIFSSLFLLISPLIFIPIAIAVKLSSPGSIFFVQERTGYKGETFKCYKFRTMRVNDEADTKQATRKDDRITRVGAFLRKTSLDELPQFYNVFIGDMSIVGPRPHMLMHTSQYATLIDLYMVRHIVKPGVTGWAQINGYRGPTDELWKMQKRVEYDVWYIENWSFLLDIKIILRTIYNGIFGSKNAF